MVSIEHLENSSRSWKRDVWERWQREAQRIFWDRGETPSGAHCSNALVTKTFRLDWLQPSNNSILIKVKKINEEWEPAGRCVDLCRHQERRWLRPRSEVCSLWQQDHNYWSFDYFLNMIPNNHDDNDMMPTSEPPLQGKRVVVDQSSSCCRPPSALLPGAYQVLNSWVHIWSVPKKVSKKWVPKKRKLLMAFLGPRGPLVEPSMFRPVPSRPVRNNFSWVHRWAVTLPSNLRYPQTVYFLEADDVSNRNSDENTNT